MTAMTATQIERINKMNRASNDVSLGQRVADLESANPGSLVLPTVAGTVEASKLVLVGANKQVDTIAVADLKLGAGAGTSVTATATEINTLSGITANVGELNLLTGVTATTAEINMLGNSVAGTSVASRALVLGANKNTDVLALPVSGLKIGVGAGTAVSASAAEINTLTSVTAGTITASKAVVVDSSKKVNEWNMTGALTIDKTGSISLGTLSSANDTSGKALSSSVTNALSVCADTGGSALTASFTRASRSRYLIGTPITSGADISTAGFEGLLKSIVSVNVGGNQGGVMGHYETAGTLTLTGSINTTKSGVSSFLDLGENATVAAGTVVSAFGVQPANFGTTMTGRSAVIHVTNPMAGTWGSFLDISSGTGLTQNSAAGATADKFLKVYVNGTLYTIAMATA